MSKKHILCLSLFFLILCSGCAKNIDIYYQKGLTFGSDGNFIKALKYFKKALDIEPTYLAAEKALIITEDALSQNIEKQAAIHLFRGLYNAYHWKDEQAIIEFLKALEEDPIYSEGYYYLGLIYHENGFYLKACRYYSSANDYTSEHAEAYLNSGVAGQQHSHKAALYQASYDFTEAIRINPRFAEAYFNLGIVNVKEYSHDEAILNFTKAIELNPKMEEAYLYRGKVYELKEWYDKAISDFSKIIKINPINAFAYYNRGRCYEKKGLYEESEENEIKAKALTPHIELEDKDCWDRSKVYKMIRIERNPVK